MTQTTIAAPVSAGRGGPMPTGGRWGWYRDHEGSERQRVSKLIKFVETDKYQLEQWFKRQVGEGLAIRDDLVLAIKAMGRPDPIGGWSKEDKKKLDGIVKEAAEAAKQRNGARTGTAMHDLTERVDRGEDIESVVRGLPAGAAHSLRAYDFLRRANGWETIEIERTVDLPELEVRGTFDRIERIAGLTALLGPWVCQYGHEHTDESQVIADVKTEAAPWLNGMHICPQLGIYSRAKRMWRATGGTVKVTFSESEGPVDFPAGEYVPVPCVRQDVGVVAHILDGHAEPYFVNLAEGWEAALAARAQSDREARSKRKLGTAGAWFVPVPGIKRPAPAQILSEHAATANYADPNRPALAAVADHMAAGGSTTEGVGAVLVGAMDAEAAQEAYTRPDGMVGWRPAGELDEVDRNAISAIWQSPELSNLAQVYSIYTGPEVGRQWGGRVAEAADARRRQIECVQRQLHRARGTATVKCACGWTNALPA